LRKTSRPPLNLRFCLFFGSFEPIFNSNCRGYIDYGILPLQFESKIGQNNPENRRTLKFKRGLMTASTEKLSFGTGGLRGIMGEGPSRMNVDTVRKATQALANYLKSKRPVVIGYDSRHNSELFAKEAARTLAGNRIPVFISNTLRPTPFISFACRHLKAQAAIMITASHNPKEYNGYKVFWEDGAQVVSPHDQGIMDEMNKVVDISLAPANDPLIQIIDPSVDTAYLDAIAALPYFSSHPNLQICYSSLHGTGITLLPDALKRCGFSAPLLVPFQCIPDGDFPTTPSPNPESPEALAEGIKFLQKTQSDILFVTDPDADRVGVVILHHNKPVILNGHQLAALGAYYLCQKAHPNQNIITTLVTTPLIDKIAAAYNVNVIRTLTGFKYIGEKMGQQEDSFLFGAEESLGYLIGTYCRDKDGISAACLFATIAAELKFQEKTCLDLLHEIYARFGVFQERAVSLNFSEGSAGIQEIKRLMQSFRTMPPEFFDDQAVVRTIDYLLPNTTYPKADVLQWILEDGTSLIVRPSGTEPKLKIYLSVHRPVGESIESALEECQEQLERLADVFQ
jgi:phosphoglucomutase/phosphomannomutase